MGKRKGRKEAQEAEIPAADENGEEEDDGKGGFFACYLLTSLCPRFKGHTYIGYTVNPRRRIRQHNGEIGSGAWRTKRKRPWEMLLCIYGFPTNVAALQFEWAWQHPVESLAVRKAAANMKSLSGLANKIKLAYTMLTLPPWQSLKLTVNLFSTKYRHYTSACPALPKQMRTQVCSMDDLPCYNDGDACINDDDDDLDDVELECSAQEALDEPCSSSYTYHCSEENFNKVDGVGHESNPIEEEEEEHRGEFSFDHNNNSPARASYISQEKQSPGLVDLTTGSHDIYPGEVEPYSSSYSYHHSEEKFNHIDGVGLESSPIEEEEHRGEFCIDHNNNSPARTSYIAQEKQSPGVVDLTTGSHHRYSGEVEHYSSSNSDHRSEEKFNHIDGVGHESSTTRVGVGLQAIGEEEHQGQFCINHNNNSPARRTSYTARSPELVDLTIGSHEKQNKYKVPMKNPGGVEIIDIFTPSPCCLEKKRKPNLWPEVIDLTNSPMFV